MTDIPDSRKSTADVVADSVFLEKLLHRQRFRSPRDKSILEVAILYRGVPYATSERPGEVINCDYSYTLQRFPEGGI